MSLRIVFLDRATVRADFVPPPGDAWVDYDFTAPSETAARLADADVAVTNKVRIGENELDAAPRLKLIVAAATGTDHIDLAACRARGVTVCNARGYATESVAEHVFLLLLALRRQLIPYREAVQVGAWSRSRSFALIDPPLLDLAGATLALVGYGALGKAVELRARAFGMHVLIAERRGQPPREGRVGFEEALRKADAVTVHAPLTAETRDLIGSAELAQMKREAILVNVARGGIVDEAALLAAVQGGTIAGAGVDVLTVEPPPADHPLVSTTLPNLLVTPHHAWASRRAMQNLADQVVENIRQWKAGEPVRVV